MQSDHYTYEWVYDEIPNGCMTRVQNQTSQADEIIDCYFSLT